jgi:hypothetical protein
MQTIVAHKLACYDFFQPIHQCSEYGMMFLKVGDTTWRRKTNINQTQPARNRSSAKPTPKLAMRNNKHYHTATISKIRV